MTDQYTQSCFISTTKENSLETTATNAEISFPKGDTPVKTGIEPFVGLGLIGSVIIGLYIIKKGYDIFKKVV